MRFRVEGNHIKPINTFIRNTKTFENRKNFSLLDDEEIQEVSYKSGLVRHPSYVFYDIHSVRIL